MRNFRRQQRRRKHCRRRLAGLDELRCGVVCGHNVRVDELLRQHPEIDVLGGQLVNPDGSLQTSRVQMPTLHHNDQRELVAVSGIVGAFMVIRHATWSKLNGLDEGYFFCQRGFRFLPPRDQSWRRSAMESAFPVMHHRNGSSKKANLRSDCGTLGRHHYSWRKEMSEQEYHAKVRRYGFRFFFRVIWYFIVLAVNRFFGAHPDSPVAQEFLPAEMAFARVPAGWGLRPVKNKP